MDARELRRLVDLANQTIINTGLLPIGWGDEYHSALIHIVKMNNKATWPKDIFAIIHYVSTHLCLRYYARKSSAADRVAETEATLGKIQLATELALWTAVTTVPCKRGEGTFGDDEETLIALCFGDQSPLQTASEEKPFKVWKCLYQSCLENLKSNMTQSSDWNKWLCIALHFGAFYIDLYQQQEIDLGEEHEHRCDNGEILSLLESLSDCINNRRVITLIKIWLDSASEVRNASGIPRIGRLRSRTGQFDSVRTATELLIQSSANVL